MLLMLTVSVSVDSSILSSVGVIVKVCCSPAVPEKVSFWLISAV